MRDGGEEAREGGGGEGGRGGELVKDEGVGG